MPSVVERCRPRSFFTNTFEDERILRSPLLRHETNALSANHRGTVCKNDDHDDAVEDDSSQLSIVRNHAMATVRPNLDGSVSSAIVSTQLDQLETKAARLGHSWSRNGNVVRRRINCSNADRIVSFRFVRPNQVRGLATVHRRMKTDEKDGCALRRERTEGNREKGRCARFEQQGRKS